MKVKGKQIKDVAFWIKCHVVILFLVPCHTKWKKSFFLSGKYQSFNITPTNFYNSWESTFWDYGLREFLLCALKGKHFGLWYYDYYYSTKENCNIMGVKIKE